MNRFQNLIQNSKSSFSFQNSIAFPLQRNIKGKKGKKKEQETKAIFFINLARRVKAHNNICLVYTMFNALSCACRLSLFGRRPYRFRWFGALSQHNWPSLTKVVYASTLILTVPHMIKSWNDFCTDYYPLVMPNIAIENGHLEIVDFPIDNGGSFHS